MGTYEGDGVQVSIQTYEGTCRKKRQDTDCIVDATETQTEFDNGDLELSSSSKTTCITFTPVTIPPAKKVAVKKQDMSEDDDCIVVDNDTYEADGVQVSIDTYVGTCRRKRQDTDCVVDETETQTEFDNGDLELSSSSTTTCITFTPVTIPPAKKVAVKKQDMSDDDDCIVVD